MLERIWKTELHLVLLSPLLHDILWKRRLACDHPPDMSMDMKICDYKSCTEVHHLQNQMNTQKRREELFRVCMSSDHTPLFCSLEVICSLTNFWAICPQPVSQPTETVDQSKSQATSSSDQAWWFCDSDIPGCLWASAQRHCRSKSMLWGQNWPSRPIQTQSTCSKD